MRVRRASVTKAGRFGKALKQGLSRNDPPQTYPVRCQNLAEAAFSRHEKAAPDQTVAQTALEGRCFCLGDFLAGLRAIFAGRRGAAALAIYCFSPIRIWMASSLLLCVLYPAICAAMPASMSADAKAVAAGNSASLKLGCKCISTFCAATGPETGLLPRNTAVAPTPILSNPQANSIHPAFFLRASFGYSSTWVSAVSSLQRKSACSPLLTESPVSNLVPLNGVNLSAIESSTLSVSNLALGVRKVANLSWESAASFSNCAAFSVILAVSK